MAPKAPAVSAMSSRLEGEAEFAAHHFGEERARLRLIGLVGEPVLALRDSAGADCFDDTGKWHLLRIAEGEVADARLTSPLAVARVEVEIVERSGDSLSGTGTIGEE